MKFFLYFIILILIINCQDETGINIPAKEIKRIESENEFQECIKKYGVNGINNDLKKKVGENEDKGIKYIINSFREKLQNKEDE